MADEAARLRDVVQVLEEELNLTATTAGDLLGYIDGILREVHRTHHDGATKWKDCPRSLCERGRISFAKLGIEPT